VTVVARVPPTYFGVSVLYMKEPVSESRMVALRTVVLRTSPSPFGVKDRFIFRVSWEAREEWTISVGDPGVSKANRTCICGFRGVNPIKKP